MGDTGAAALAVVLRGNNSLRHLAWDENYITPHGLRMVGAALTANTKLNDMPLPLVDIAASMRTEPDVTGQAVHGLQALLVPGGKRVTPPATAPAGVQRRAKALGSAASPASHPVSTAEGEATFLAGLGLDNAALNNVDSSRVSFTLAQEPGSNASPQTWSPPYTPGLTPRHPGRTPQIWCGKSLRQVSTSYRA